MLVHLSFKGKNYRCDLSAPLDISMPLHEGIDTVNCFYAPPMQAEPVIAGDFKGSVALGGPVNFLNVRFNPHGNGTHTECVGHIAKEPYTINQSLRSFHHVAKLVSLYPTRLNNGDRVILRDQLAEVLEPGEVDAFIIRTLPNDALKLKTNYSGANPPYLHHEATTYLVAAGVQHLLLDLPSVDREEDGGLLLSHRAFWQYPEQPRTGATITELIFVENTIKDGFYLLNLQIAPFEIDASPGKPVLYALEAVVD